MFDSVLNHALQIGLKVNEIKLNRSQWGFYDHRSQTIFINQAMTNTQKAVTILHELYHHERGDTEPQPTHIEQWIDEEVALQLIKPANYQHAELTTCASPGAIASELELPLHIILAWQRRQQKNHSAGRPKTSLNAV